MRIKLALAITLISLAVACSSVTGPDLVRQYAECLADPATGIHVAAGSELDPAVHYAGLRAELKAGETTMAEIEAALELFCK